MIRTIGIALFAATLSAAAFAQAPFLVADINHNSASGSIAQGFHVVGNQAFFYAYSPYHGRELWRTNGTPNGTAMVKDMNPGSADGICSCGPQIADLNGTVYFIPNDNNLWKTDGTAAGTQLVQTVPLRATNLTSDGQHLFFTTRALELWVSDGTPSGTHALSSTSAGPLRATTIMPGAGVTYFTGNGEQTLSNDLIWRTDGTASGTVAMKSDPFPVLSTAEFTWAGNTIYIATGRQVVKIDSATDTVKVLFTAAPTAIFPPHHLAHAGNGVYFSATTQDGSGLAVQRLDVATDALTVVSPLNADPVALTSLGNQLLIFSGGVSITDGTQSGTQHLSDLSPRANAVPIAIGGGVFFDAFVPQGSGATGLYRTDGTAAGTKAVRTDVLATQFAGFGNILLFNGNSDPWRSDGTATGTTVIRNLAPDSASSSPETAAGSSLFFLAQSTPPAPRLWRTDGYNTSALTIEGAPANIIVPCHGGVLFTGCVKTNQCGVFGADAAGNTLNVTHNNASDIGCAGGNHAVVAEFADILSVDLDSGVATQIPVAGSSSYVTFGDRVFFRVRGSQTVALMQTDGTTNGTSILVQGDTSSGLADLTPLDFVNGKLLFTHNGIQAVPVGGGTPVSLATSSSFRVHVNTGAQVIFAANANGQHQLWATDGTPGGTILVGTLTSEADWMATTNGRTFVLDSSGRVWVTDGTAASLRNIVDRVDVSQLGAANGLVYFAKQTDTNADELWVSDGTAAGTHVAGDINPGDGSSNPHYFAATDRLLYFAATDDYDGTELWALPIAGQGQPHRHPVRSELLPGCRYRRSLAPCGGRQVLLAVRSN